MSGSNPGIAVEWIEGKRHYLIRRAGTKWAYSRSHGDGRRWDIFDGGFAKLLEIPAKTNEEALAQVSAMALDGSLEGLINDRRQSQMSSQGSVLRNMAAWADYGRCKAERDAELFPKPNS